MPEALKLRGERKAVRDVFEMIPHSVNFDNGIFKVSASFSSILTVGDFLPLSISERYPLDTSLS